MGKRDSHEVRGLNLVVAVSVMVLSACGRIGYERRHDAGDGSVADAQADSGVDDMLIDDAGDSDASEFDLGTDADTPDAGPTEVVITGAGALTTSEAGGTATFQVALSRAPETDVVLSIASDVVSEVIATTNTVTFTNTNWSAPQNVTLTGVDDAIADGNQVVAITIAVASDDALFDGLVVPSPNVTNIDDESAGILVTPVSGLTTNESGGTATFTIVLTSQPTADVQVPVESSDTTEGTVPSEPLVFTSTTWNMPLSVTVTGVDDALADGDVAYNINVGPSTSSDVEYSGIGGDPVALVNEDDETPGVLLSTTSGLVTTEAGGTDTFTIALRSEPFADVVFDVTSADVTEGTASPSTITFTSSDWSVPQTITLTGVDDFVTDGDILYDTTVHVSSSGDPSYASIADRVVAATNVDNETPGITITPTSGLTTTEAGGTATFTIVLNTQPTASVLVMLSSDTTSEGTVSPASVSFTTVNWNVPRTVTVTGVSDLIDDGDRVYHVVMPAPFSGDPDYASLDPDDVTVTNLDDDTAAVTVNPTSGLMTTEAGGTASFTVVLTSQPTATVTFPLMSSDTSEGTLSIASVTFTTANWSTPQSVVVTGADDSVADGTVAYSIVTGTGTSTDSLYAAIDPADVMVDNTDNDVASVVVSPTAGLVTTEGGGTATFSVALSSMPTADVTVTLTSSDLTEGTVLPASVTFTSANWNMPQTVTVTGVNDAIIDGTVAYSIVTSDATSADLGYNGLGASDVAVTNQDNDAAGVSVSPTTGLVTTEAGTTTSFSIVLGAMPSADVTVAIASSDVTEGTVSAASVTFTSGNWNVAQMITVTGVDDVAVDGNIAFSINTGAAVSADLMYNGMAVADVSVTNNDNDAPGVTVSPTSGLTTTEVGGTATFDVVLISMPSADVTIALSSSDTTEGTVSPASLTFTSGNWNVSQMVTVTGVDDAIADGSVAYSIITGNTVSADGTYNNLVVANVSVNTTDNDVAGVTVSPTSGLVTKEIGQTAQFTVVLVSQPTATVSISLTSNDLTEGTVSPASVSFTTMNWSTPQTVTVTGVNDFLVDGTVAYTIVTGAASSVDGTYNGMAVADVDVSNQDDDAVGITVNPTTGLYTTEQAATATYTVVLDSQPTANVTIAVTSSNPAEATVSPAMLTFTSGNWSSPQTVTLTGVDDLAFDNDVSFTVQNAAAVSADGAYNGLDPSDVGVRNIDDEYQRCLTCDPNYVPRGGISSGTFSAQYMSSDARYHVFVSDATTLVASDTNGVRDAFVRDRQLGTTTRVSVSSAGVQGNGGTSYVSISYNGRFVCFSSASTNFSVDSNGVSDIFVRDLMLGTTTMVSFSDTGAALNATSQRCAVSDDGRYVSFDTSATNVITGDANTFGDVVVRDTVAGTTTLLSRNTAGTQPMGIASLLGMSADGTYAMFRAATLLQAPCTAGANWHIYIRNRVSNITRCVSISTSAAAQGNGHSWWGAISSDGLFAAFESDATNLVASDTNGVTDIFVNDLVAITTTRASVTNAGAQSNGASTSATISGNGRYVGFASAATNLAADGNGVTDAFVRDRTGATTILVSKSNFGFVGNGALFAGTAVQISDDGAYVSFTTSATNIQGNDADGLADAYIVSNP